MEKKVPEKNFYDLKIKMENVRKGVTGVGFIEWFVYNKYD